MADLMSLLVRIGADTSGAEAGIKKTQTLGSRLAKGLKTVGKVGAVAIGAATTAVVAFAKSSVDAGAKFDASMANVAAISGATGDELTALRDKAKDMGARTKFSASQAADAFSYMAMAGWKTEDMLNGIEGVMNLAAASGEDLATTSDIVTDALTAFGLKAEDSGHFADILAAASSNANTNVGMMGETFKYVAPVAGALGLEADDMAVAIGLMANSGIKASQAGTSLRSILKRMVKPTKQSQEAMDALGISITKSDGSMKSMDEIMLMLRDKFSNLTEAQQGQYAAAIAGQEGMSGLLSIVNASQEDFDKLTAAVENCDGAAEKMAATMQDNLTGDITIFKSAVEGAQIAISDVLTPSLREFVQFGTKAVGDLTKAFEEDGLNGAMAAFGRILSDAITMIMQKLPSFVDAGMQLLLALAQGLLDNLPQIMDAAGQIVDTIISSIGRFLTERYPEIGEKFTAIVDKITSAWLWIRDEFVPAFTAAVDNIIKFVQDNLPIIKSVVAGVVGGIAALTIGNKISGLMDTFSKLYSTIQAHPFAIIIGAIVGLVSYIVHLYKTNEEARDKINAALQAIKDFWEKTLKPALLGMWTWITNSLLPAIQKGWQNLQSKIEVVFTAIKGFWENTLKPALEAMWTWIVDTFLPAVQKAWQNFRPKIEAVFTAIKVIWEDTLKPALDAMWTWIVNTFLPAVSKAWQNFQPKVEAVFNAIKGFWESTLQPTFQAIWDFVTIDVIPALTEAWESISTTIETVFNGISTWWDQTGSDIFWDISNSIDTVINTITGVLNGLIDFVNGVFSGDWEQAWSGIKEIFGSVFSGLWKLLKAPINGIIEGLNWMIGKVESAINTIIRAINKHLKVEIPEVWVLGKRVFDGLTFGPQLSEADFGRIPLLAMYKGGVLQEGERAIVGEFAPEYLTVRNGQAVVTPIKNADRMSMGGDNITINVYQREGENMDAFVRRIEEVMTRHENQRRAAYA